MVTSVATPPPLDALPAAARLDLDGLSYAYVDTGAGPPVVLVHGNPTWSWHWRRLVEALPRAGFRALAPDHIGMGRSDKPAPADYPHTLDRRVQDLGRWIDSLRLTEPVTLVVHDWGGPIGLTWAVRNPGRVAGLVLLNTAARWPAGRPLPLALRLARSRPLGSLAVLRANAFVRGAVLLGVRRGRMPAAARRGYLAPYDRPAHRAAVLAFIRDIPTRPGDPAYATMADTQARLPTLAHLPVLVCWGMRDFVFDAACLAAVEEVFPAAEVHRFEDAGHLVLEDAHGQVVPLVLDFLSRRHPGPRADARPAR